MDNTILLLILIIIWTLSLSLSFVAGFIFAIKGRSLKNKKPLKTENSKELDELQREEQREYENFMNYRGVPQLGHKDYR